MLIQIQSRYFTAGCVLLDNKVKLCSPIIQYMQNWAIEKVKLYCKKKKWRIIILN